MIVGDGSRSFLLELPDPEIPKPSTARIAAKATNPAIPSNLERFLSRILCFLSCRHSGSGTLERVGHRRRGLSSEESASCRSGRRYGSESPKASDLPTLEL